VAVGVARGVAAAVGAKVGVAGGTTVTAGCWTDVGWASVSDGCKKPSTAEQPAIKTKAKIKPKVKILLIFNLQRLRITIPISPVAKKTDQSKNHNSDQKECRPA